MTFHNSTLRGKKRPDFRKARPRTSHGSSWPELREASPAPGHWPLGAKRSGGLSESTQGWKRRCLRCRQRLRPRSLAVPKSSEEAAQIGFCSLQLLHRQGAAPERRRSPTALLPARGAWHRPASRGRVPNSQKPPVVAVALICTSAVLALRAPRRSRRRRRLGGRGRGRGWSRNQEPLLAGLVRRSLLQPGLMAEFFLTRRTPVWRP